MVRWPKLPLSRTVSTAEMVGSDDTDMDRFPVSLVRGATPRTPAARSRACREPAGLRSRLAARPLRCAEAISRATTEDRAEEWGRAFARVAPGGGFVFSCAVRPKRSRVRRPWGPRTWKERPPQGVSRSATSTAQAETLDDRAVALDVGLVQVVQQPAALAD